MNNFFRIYFVSISLAIQLSSPTVLDENSSEQNNSASPAVAAVKQTQHKTPQQRAMITSKKHRIQQAHKFNKTSCHALGHHIRMTHGYDSYITAVC